jgi:hypothetical protein
VDLVVLTLSTVLYFHPSLIPLVIKSGPWWKLVPNCSLRIFCNGAKLVGTLQVIQIRFLIACCWGGLGCTYSINHTLFSSIPYSSSYQIWTVMEASSFIFLCTKIFFYGGRMPWSLTLAIDRRWVFCFYLGIRKKHTVGWHHLTVLISRPVSIVTHLWWYGYTGIFNTCVTIPS